VEDVQVVSSAANLLAGSKIFRAGSR